MLINLRALIGILVVMGLVPLSRANTQLRTADSTSQVAFSSSRVHDFASLINGRPYRLYVVLPFTYDAKPNVRYPVLYLLDAGITLPSAVGVYRLQNRQIDSLIIVGVGFSDTQGPRYRGIDYSLPLTATADSGWKADQAAGKCCQADKTIRVFEQEIIPLVDKSYRTTSDRGILGISWSAIFAAYVLFQKPDLFDRYAITSPSPWSDNYALFEAEEAYAEKHDSLAKRVFISVGDLEGAWNRFSADRLAATLRARGYKRLDLVNMTLPDAFHNSASQYSEAFRTLYPPRTYISFLSDTITRNNAARVVRRFLGAYARRDVEGIRSTLADTGFEAILDGNLITSRDKYLTAIRNLGKADLAVFSLDAYRIGVDLGRTLFYADSAPNGKESLAPRAIWLEHSKAGYQISYVLHNTTKSAESRTIVHIESGTAPVPNAEVLAFGYEAGPFAVARADGNGVALLRYDWHRDLERTGYIEVRAPGFKVARVAPPLSDTITVRLTAAAR